MVGLLPLAQGLIVGLGLVGLGQTVLEDGFTLRFGPVAAVHHGKSRECQSSRFSNILDFHGFSLF